MSAPGGRLRRWIERALGGDDWGVEFLEALDTEARRRFPGPSGLRARLWVFGQLLRPRTLVFFGLLARRRWTAARHHGNGRRMMSMIMDGWVGDAKVALRVLARERRYTLFGALTLAMGIAGVAIIFGIADRLFLRGPEHVADPDRLTRVYLHFDEETGPRRSAWIPWLTYQAISEADVGFEGMGAFRFEARAAGLPDGPRRLDIVVVDEGYFPVLGTPARLGRVPDAGDPLDADAVLLSDRLWRTSFASDPGVIGHTFRIEGREVTVVGVAPGGFSGPGPQRADLWIPLAPDETGSKNWWVLGRLRAGTGAGDAGRLAVAARADEVHERTDPGRFYQWASEGRVVLAPLGYDDAGEESVEVAVTRLLVAVCLLVFLLACVNVVNLTLARVTRRSRELAVRNALGAGRGRIFRTLVSESLALGFVAALAALPLVHLGGGLLRRLLFPGVAWSESALEPRVLAAVVGVALLAGLVVGTLPTLAAMRADFGAALRSSVSAGGRGRAGLHSLLAAGQVTLAVTLLLSAGLLVRSFQAMKGTELGFAADEVHAVTLGSLVPGQLATGGEEEEEVYRRALDVASSEGDVVSAALGVGVPFLHGFSTGLAVDGLDSIPALPGGGPWFTAVTPGYFETLGTRVLRGRGIVEGDEDGGVVVVSETMAELFWSEGDALGECLRIGGPAAGCHRVVGVVEDVHRTGYREPPSMQFYVPRADARGHFGGTVLLVRSRPDATLSSLRTRLLGLGSPVELVEIQRLSTFLEVEVRPWRLGSISLALAAGLATLVALLGVYGVLAYLVAQRRREIGVRMALGASAAGVRAMVLRSGLASAAVGIVLGSLLLVPVIPWIRPLLYETSAGDPWVLGGVTVMVLSVAALAGFLPARQASRVDPAGVLREE